MQAIENLIRRVRRVPDVLGNRPILFRAGSLLGMVGDDGLRRTNQKVFAQS